MEQSYVATAIFFGFILGMTYMLDDMLNIRGIIRFIVVLALTYVFYRYGYLVMDHFNDYMYIWTDGSLGAPLP